jgi:DNA modification methylase
MTIDVIVTSPPYNINKEYGTYKDNKKGKDYLDWLHEIAKLSHTILKDGGSFFLNIGGTHLLHYLLMSSRSLNVQALDYKILFIR